MTTEHRPKMWIVMADDLMTFTPAKRFANKADAMKFAAEQAARFSDFGYIVLKAVGGFKDGGKTRLAFKPEKPAAPPSEADWLPASRRDKARAELDRKRLGDETVLFGWPEPDRSQTGAEPEPEGKRWEVYDALGSLGKRGFKTRKKAEAFAARENRDYEWPDRFRVRDLRAADEWPEPEPDGPERK